MNYETLFTEGGKNHHDRLTFKKKDTDRVTSDFIHSDEVKSP